MNLCLSPASKTPLSNTFLRFPEGHGPHGAVGPAVPGEGIHGHRQLRVGPLHQSVSGAGVR